MKFITPLIKSVVAGIAISVVIVILLFLSYWLIENFDKYSLIDIPHTINNTTTCSIGDTSKYGIAALSWTVGIMALIVTFVSIFLSLMIIGVGNFRQNFINTVIACVEKGVDMNRKEEVTTWWGKSSEKTVSDLIRDRTMKLYDNSQVLFAIELGIVFWSCIMLLGILITMVLCYFEILEITNLWLVIWVIQISYTFMLISTLVCTCYYTTEAIGAHPELAVLQKTLSEHLIKEGVITKNQEKIQAKITNSNAYQVDVNIVVSYPDSAEGAVTNDQKGQQESEDNTEGE